MNKQWMTKYMGQEPANLNSSYLFLVDDPDLALAIAGCGFSSQALAEDSDSQDMYYSIETFISYMNSIDLKGTCRMDYIYVPACSQKWKNNRLNSFFRDNPDLRYHQGWRLFKDREYLADLEYQDELKEALTSFIYRYEGPRGAARFQKQTVDDTTCAGQTEPDPGTDNSWFHVDDTIRTPLHTYNQKGQPDGVLDASVVDCIINRVHLFVLDMTVHIYTGGRYQADPHGSQTKELIRSLLFPKMMRSTIINRIYQQLLDRVRLHRTSSQLNLQPRHWINFQNGFYDVLEQKWIDHDPRYYCMNQIPFRYDPAWKPPDNPDISTVVGRFLQASIPDEDDRRMLWEFTGYAMTTDTGFQKFLTLTGAGGTGKSVVIGMMEDIVGRENISNISLQDLNNRFYPAALHLKLLNTCADIPSLGMQNIDNLKKATGEDSLIYERKGKDVGFFHSYAKLGFSANEIPLNLDEKSDAFYRRILILCMDQKVAPEDRDPHLREKLAMEWQYILYLALQGLKRLHEQGHFTQSTQCKAAIRELRHRADNVQAFMDTCIRAAPGKRVQRSEVYEAYETYCSSNKRQSCGKSSFFKRMNSRFLLKRYGSDGFCYQGIELYNGSEDPYDSFPEDPDETIDKNDFIALEPDEVTPFDASFKSATGRHRVEST